MTLEEMIRYYEYEAELDEVGVKVFSKIDTYTESECRACAKRHRELVEFLKELKGHLDYEEEVRRRKYE